MYFGNDTTLSATWPFIGDIALNDLYLTWNMAVSDLTKQNILAPDKSYIFNRTLHTINGRYGALMHLEVN